MPSSPGAAPPTAPPPAALVVPVVPPPTMAAAAPPTAAGAAPPQETHTEKHCRELRERAAEQYCPYDTGCAPKFLPPECQPDPPTRRVAAFVEGVALRVGGYSLLDGPDPHWTRGFLVSIDPDYARRGEISNGRGTLYAGIGGGSAGLEGLLEGRGTAGVHLPSRRDRGPFGRLGWGFQVVGNRDLYRSHIELPRLETGYQLFGGSTFLELQASGGLVLGGRYDVGAHANRTIGTVPEVGASLTLQGDRARIYVSGMRILAFDPEKSPPIDEAKLDACVQLGKVLLLCAHGAAHQGEVRWRDGTVSSSAALYAGATLGAGAIDVK